MLFFNHISLVSVNKAHFSKHLIVVEAFATESTKLQMLKIRPCKLNPSAVREAHLDPVTETFQIKCKKSKSSFTY